MLDLSPVKILVVLIVGLLVLGPDKLPQLARQLGAAWGDFRRWRTRVESDVRGNFPDLPATNTITDAVRSPLGFLDRLADEHEQERERQREIAEQERDAAEGAEGSPADPPAAAVELSEGVRAEANDGGRAEPPEGVVARPDLRPAPPAASLPAPPDDPSMN